MPHPAIDTTRRQLGELGAMAQRTKADERVILERAEKRLAEVTTALPAARSAALAGDAAAEQEYIDLVDESGRLNRVIDKARFLVAGDEAK